ncbi:hypothetical protein [Pedobacter sp. SYSU D00535]|uniref:hypothetical protein n=1 Tax=Pedobacter sp. SYSU D00535 TaxID=2810308 RepID=UPI001A95E9F8|nr:hypothetical protein [Pedobacter sp. SYSU D00535]
MQKVLLFLSLLIPALGIAQVNLTPASIVLNNGETLQGFVDYKEWNHNPTKISFSKTPDKSTLKMFQIADLQSVEVSGMEIYERHEVSISQGGTEYQNLQSTVDTTRIKSLVLLKRLWKGDNISLYSYKDKIKERFYISDRIEQTPRELVILYYRVNNIIKSRKEYVYELLNTAERVGLKSYDLLNKVSSVSYNEKDLVSILRGLEPEKVASVEKKTKSRKAVSFYVGGKATYNHLMYTGDHYLAERGTSHSGAITPGLSIGLNWYKHRNIRKTFVRLESSILQLESTTKREPAQHSTKILALSFLPTFQYNFYNTSTLKWFAGFGAGVNIYHYQENSFSRKTTTTWYRNIHNSENIGYRNRLIYSIPFNAGFTFKEKVELCLNFNRAFSYASYDTFALHNNTVSINLNYYLSKKRKP